MSDYPTEAAYLAVCKANEEKRVRIAKLEAERDKLLEVVGVNCCHCGQTTYHQPALLK